MSGASPAARAALARGDAATALAHVLAVPAHARDDELCVLGANAAIQCRDWAAAITLLRVLVERHPANAGLRERLAIAHNNRGSELRAMRHGEAAVAQFEAALRLAPGNPEAACNLAMLRLEHGEVDAARALIAAARAMRPDDGRLRLAQAEAELAGHRLDAARAALDGLAPAAIPPDERRRAARTLARVGLTANALAWVDADPDWGATGLDGLATSLHHESCVDAAREIWRRTGRRAAANSPEAVRAHLGECLALPPVYRDTADLEACRAAYAAGLERLADALPPAALRGRDLPLEALEWANFYLAYQGHDDRELQSRYGDWLAAAAAAIAPSFAEAPPRRIAKRPRVGFLSSFLRECTVGSYFGSWIGALRAAGMELTLIQLGPTRDAFTARLGAEADRLLEPDGSLLEIAAAVRGLDLDLLIHPELGMDGRTLALAALRLAPRQAMAWGHPVTSGLPTIDAYFTCAAMEPPDAALHYREPLLPLPGIGTRYRHPGPPPARTRRELGLPEDRHLVLVPQSAFKLHPDNDTVLATLLAERPAATAVLFGGGTPGAALRLRRRLTAAVRAAGGDPARQLLWLPLVDRRRYLEIATGCDLMLDSLHWSGGNTSIDALVCGLPVITSEGRFMRGRQSAALLRALDAAELIVPAPALATRAVELLDDAPRRRALGRRFQAAMPALLDDRAPLVTLAGQVRELLAT